MTAPEPEREPLRDELARDLAKLAVSLGVQLAIVAVIAKRDSLHRAWMRLLGAVGRQRAREAQDAAVAVFARELSAWDHEQAGR